jgi:hypothetical protein
MESDEDISIDASSVLIFLVLVHSVGYVIYLPFG